MKFRKKALQSLWYQYPCISNLDVIKSYVANMSSPAVSTLQIMKIVASPEEIENIQIFERTFQINDVIKNGENDIQKKTTSLFYKRDHKLLTLRLSILS